MLRTSVPAWAGSLAAGGRRELLLTPSDKVQEFKRHETAKALARGDTGRRAVQNKPRTKGDLR